MGTTYKAYKLRSVSGGHINLPPEIWKEAGWDLNDEIELTLTETYNDKDENWLGISIDRIKDLKRYDDEYPDYEGGEE